MPAGSPPPTPERGHHRLLLLVSAIVLVDTIFFAALAPLLPHFVDKFELSKTEAGVLNAAYAAGGIVAAIPAGLFASRVGVKPAVLVGVGIVVAASIVFGLAPSAPVLEAARFGQGFGSGFSWNGAVAWLVLAAPRERRGELIGVAMGAAVAGVMLGPVLGGAAALVGTAPAFAAVALVEIALGAWTWMTPGRPVGERQPLSALLVGFRNAQAFGGIWLTVLASVLFGVFGVLGPLRLNALGAGAVAISAAWFVSAGFEMIASPVVGRWSDRRGRLTPVRVGLVASTIVALVLPWIGHKWVFLVLVPVVGLAFGVYWVPGMALLTDGIEATGLDTALGFTLLNLAWAPGHVIGSAFGAAIADATSDTAAYGVLAALCVGTLVAIARPRSRAAAAAASAPSGR